MKKVLLLLCFLLLTLFSFAHPGRTDSNGGHHTSQCDHARGICYYHYH